MNWLVRTRRRLQSATRRLKKRPWLNRLVFVILFVLNFAAGIGWILHCGDFLLLIVAICALTLVGMYHNTYIYRWPYHVFGPERPTPRPGGNPISEFNVLGLFKV